MNEAEEKRERAARDLRYIRDIVKRTDRRIDPQALHFVVWGALVFLWYPLSNYFFLQDNVPWAIGIGIGAICIGSVASFGIGITINRKPRLPASNTFISKQVGLMVAWFIPLGMTLSAIAPLPGVEFIKGPDIPTLWGLLYASMAYTVGVVYRREFMFWGMGIGAASIVALFLRDYNGFILGPAMGLGILVPGLQAERRVRKMREEESGA
ncbi:MAG: hypothetical protein ACE10D_09785 [Planctomycetota bacterium]|nr:hypothetical protein [Planctomycetota bacterium]